MSFRGDTAVTMIIDVPICFFGCIYMFGGSTVGIEEIFLMVFVHL